MSSLAITKENSSTIGFVVKCLFCEAIDREELQQWADHVLASTDTYPVYIVDLSTFDGKLCDIFDVIGFDPVSKLTPREEFALAGIADARGRTRFEPVPSRKHARTALVAHPHVLEGYRQTFPFIEVPDIV